MPESISIGPQISPNPSPSTPSAPDTATSTLPGRTAMSSLAPMLSVLLASLANKSSSQPKLTREAWATMPQRSVPSPEFTDRQPKISSSSPYSLFSSLLNSLHLAINRILPLADQTFLYRPLPNPCALRGSGSPQRHVEGSGRGTESRPDPLARSQQLRRASSERT